MVDFPAVIGNLPRSLERKAISDARRIKPLDAVHLATAQWLTQNGLSIDQFHTFDDRLDKFATDVGFDICRPYTPNPRLIR